MNKKAIKFLYKKEILDVLRDKKTVIMMLLVPLIVYPLIMLVSMQMMTKITKNLSESTYKFAIECLDEDSEFVNFFNKQEKTGLEIVKVDDYKKALEEEEINAYVTIYYSKEIGKEQFDIHYMSSITNSNYAVDNIETVIKSYADSLTDERLKNAGIEKDYILKPISIEYKDSSSKEQTAGNLLGTLIPFMLVVSLLMGTMYPAIDTTAGEKERGTMETLLTLPVSSKDLIISKFLTVATIGIVSALLNLISMCGVGVYMYKVAQISANGTKVDMTRFIPAIIVGALCVLAFAVFISAITMCVCAFAKSYKEANNYITPLMLVVMFASFVAFIPNIEMDVQMALIPVANICLLIKDLLIFKYNVTIIAIVLVSNVAYGIAAVSFLAKIYNSEDILFGDGSNGFQIFERRSNLKKGGLPTTGDGWLVVAVAIVAIIYFGSMLQLKYGLLGVWLTQFIIVGIPMLTAIYTKKDLIETFRIKRFNPIYLIVSVLMSIGATSIGIVISTVADKIFKSSVDNQAETMEILGNNSFVISLLVIAVTPAICEELMFRGYIFSSMRSGMKISSAILVSSALFGIYHMSLVKFFTTAILGGIICYVNYKSGSIFTGMLMHFINNALACVVTFYPEQVAKLFPILMKETIEIKDLAIIGLFGAGLLIVGLLLVRLLDKKKRQ